MSENRQGTDKPKRKAPKTAFVPGKSGNPGGRPAITPEMRHVRELAREHTVAAISALVGVLKSPSDSARVAAANVLLDRGWGKAEQPLTGADGGPIEIVSKEQRDAAVLAALRADA